MDLIKTWGETQDYVSCFSPHFSRALAASCVLYNRTESNQGFSICWFKDPPIFVYADYEAMQLADGANWPIMVSCKTDREDHTHVFTANIVLKTF